MATGPERGVATLRARVAIRPCDLARDFVQVVRIYRANDWTHAHDPPRLRTAIERSDLAIVAVQGEEVIGFARAMSDGAFAVYIADILVLPDHQRQGVGRRLLQALLDHYPLDTFHHQVLVAERGAEGFYRRHGMVPVSTYGLTAFIRARGR
jgi:GNAT superfamily N-acetyltransferase